MYNNIWKGNVMGLIKAGIGALGGTLADQWKEFLYCEAIDKNTYARRKGSEAYFRSFIKHKGQ